jgi:hypothetical protein
MRQGIISGSVRAAIRGAVAAGLLAASCVTLAQTAPDIDPAYRAALDAMLADLGNPEASFDFARAAVAAGDQRGAIAAFERILRLNPSLANIELELGVLYLRSGNADLGRYHIGKALQANNVPAVVRRRAESYLASAPVEASRHSLRVGASLNARYDSNANAGPTSDVVLLGGTPVLIGGGQKTHDTSAEALFSLTHDYALSTGGNAALESRLLLFSNKYQDLDSLDLTLANLEVGPLMRFGAATAPAYVRPFVSGGYYLLDGDSYFHSFGGGLELRKFFVTQSVLSLRAQYDDQQFEDQPTRFVSDRSGGYYQASVSFAQQVGSHVQILGELLGESASTHGNYQSYDRYGGGLSFTWFSTPGAAGPWSISLSGRVREARYDEPDPQIDPLHRRKDTRVDARLSLDVPLTRNLALSIAGNYADNDSNLPNYKYDNAGASIGLSVQF